MLRVIGVLCVALASAPAAAAQSTSDVKEVQSYQLTVPAMKRVVAATRNLILAMKDDPRYARAMKLDAERQALEAKDDPTDADLERLERIEAESDAIEGPADWLSGTQSLDEVEAAARKEPLISAALKSAGMSAREYATFMMAFLQASMIHGFQKAGAIKELPKEANPENVAFVARHQAEIEAFMKELQALGAPPKP